LWRNKEFIFKACEATQNKITNIQLSLFSLVTMMRLDTIMYVLNS